ncbi:P-loop containing nucleoside triphosphate hydrolase protein, partial [Aspergillus campestris IBT 28561]
LVMLLFFWFRVPSQLQFLPTAFRTFVTSFRSTHCLIEYLNQAPGFRDEMDAKTLVVDQGIVEFKDVSFGHCGQKELLSGLDFKVHSGQTVALVGESGSGKSSTLKLLLRIYDSMHGKILIDGLDIQQVTVESLRANIGVAPQEEIWFHDTIMDNMRYANSSVQDEEIYKACSAVGLHDSIGSLKMGYKTIMGEGGVRLSTGELQRLAIARVIVNAGKIAILDEPTSNVDSRTESRILRNIKALFPGRTVLIASNRPSTIAHADHILVLRHGRVVEQGTHASLMSIGGHYYSLWSR